MTRADDEPPIKLTPPVLTVIEPEEPVLTVNKPEEPLFSPSLLTVIKLDGPVLDAPVLTPPVLNVIKPDGPALTPPTLTVIEPDDTDKPDEPLIALRQHTTGQPMQLGGNETQTSASTSAIVGPDVFWRYFGRGCLLHSRQRRRLVRAQLHQIHCREDF